MKIQLTFIMQTSLNKNLSHRHLVKEKTKQLFYYPNCQPRTAKSLGLRPVDISNTLNPRKQHDDHDTSIICEQGKPSSHQISQPSVKVKQSFKSGSTLSKSTLRLHGRSRRSIRTDPKSLEPILREKSSSPRLRPSYSVKKIVRMQRSEPEQKLASMENIENSDAKKKVSVTKFEMPRSENNLRGGLRKTAAAKMKMRVIDPFEKRTRLDQEFQNESVIGKVEDSMISTVNQEEFQRLLRELV